MTDLSSFSSNIKCYMVLFKSAIQIVPHLPPPEFMSIVNYSDDENEEMAYTNLEDVTYEWQEALLKLFRQAEVNYLVEDFSKKATQLFRSRSKGMNQLPSGTRFAFYRHRENGLIPFFRNDDEHFFIAMMLKWWLLWSVNTIQKTGGISWTHLKWCVLLLIVFSSLLIGYSIT